MIATTKEQSERLIKAGLDPETSDVAWVPVDRWNREQRRFVPTDVLTIGRGFPQGEPSWSLSALWDVVAAAHPKGFVFEDTDSPEEIIESLVILYETR